MAPILLLLLLTALFHSSNCQQQQQQPATPEITNRRVGINYGMLGDDLLSPYQSIQIIKSMNAGLVKLYNSDPETLKLLAGSDLWVSIMIPNDEIQYLATNQSVADRWVEFNVLPYYPETMIRFVMVGNEVLTRYNPTQWASLVPAMRFVRNALRTQGINNIKVSTPVAMDMLRVSFPPSNGTFREEILSTMIPLLRFLNSTSSFFFLDVYPYFPWSSSPLNISLDFALFRSNHLTYTDPVTRLVYTNLLDQMIDSAVFAMAKVGFPAIRIAISETGWPNDGDIDQPGANIRNAATYNRNLVRRMMSDPPVGTPARPGEPMMTFLFSLYDENLKDGPTTERHWGMVRPDGTPVYRIDLGGAIVGSGDDGGVEDPGNNNNRPYVGQIWCVVARGANVSSLGAALSSACDRLNGTCDRALGPGRVCYEPVSVVWHASYAFSAYWARFRGRGASCYFDGLAAQTTTNPSHGSCEFPSVTL